MFKRKLLATIVTTAIVGLGGYAMNAGATDLATTARVNVVAPIAIAETTKLDFGTVAKAATAGDTVTVTITPDGAGGTVASGSTPAAGLAAGTANEGVFAVTGILNETYTVTIPDSSGSGMTVTGFTHTSANAYALSAGVGADTLYVGATLSVPDTVGTGVYFIPYTITVEYN